MASYFKLSCGHRTLRDMWEGGQADIEESLPGLCRECRAAMVGQEIDFVRHGKPPASGHSTNHRDGTPEEGVSVYWIQNGVPQYVGFHFGISSRPSYVGRGVVVGWGSDGEPLVRIVTIRKGRAGK